jgi:hypothetical protein
MRKGKLFQKITNCRSLSYIRCLFFSIFFYSILFFLFFFSDTILVSGRPSLKVWCFYATFLYYFPILTISPAVVEALSNDFFIFF